MSSKTAQLNELIEITRDGQRFYEHASQQVRDSHLQALFATMSRGKTEVIEALKEAVVANHDVPASGGTFLGPLQRVYADTRATLSTDEIEVYVAQLEDAEDRILHAFEEALDKADPDMRLLLSREMPKVRACHERMRNLKSTI